MRCCFVAEMAHALLVLLIIRLLFIITALQMALLVCLVPALALELLFELLFMELLFIIRPGAAGAPDNSAAVYHSPYQRCSSMLEYARRTVTVRRMASV